MLTRTEYDGRTASYFKQRVESARRFPPALLGDKAAQFWIDNESGEAFDDYDENHEERICLMGDEALQVLAQSWWTSRGYHAGEYSTLQDNVDKVLELLTDDGLEVHATWSESGVTVSLTLDSGKVSGSHPEFPWAVYLMVANLAKEGYTL